jgi:glycosyltransferase involved in cell wall biosynthesis
MKLTTTAIITAYNLERFVGEAITSALQQTVPPDEIIVVDDCSTDNTATIIKSFGEQVKYFRLPQNSGGLTATFYGVCQARGEILFFLDGDDLWMPEKIESILPLFEKYKEMGIVSHDYIRVNTDRKPFLYIDDTQENILRILKTRSTIEEQSEAYKDSILCKKGYWAGSAYSLRRSIIDTEKFEAWRSSFQFVRHTYLDLVLPTFILMQHPDIMVGYVHKKLFEYRIHTNNTSGNKLPDPDAAKRAVNMGLCTTTATYNMIKDKKEYDKCAKKQRLQIMEYQYLNDVYSNKKWAAFNKFFLLTKNYWTKKQVIKEFQRFSISLLFGPKSFLYLKSKRTR